MGEIACSYGESAKATSLEITAPVAEAAAQARIKSVLQHVGRMPSPVCRGLTKLIDADLKRTFAIHAEPDHQADFTNCVVFCLRIMRGMQQGGDGPNGDMSMTRPQGVDTTWSHLLLYAVKEGVLAFFANDADSCEHTLREIACSYGESAKCCLGGAVETSPDIAEGVACKVRQVAGCCC